eukprot:1770341-Amphidinium_carterae.1
MTEQSTCNEFSVRPLGPGMNHPMCMTVHGCHRSRAFLFWSISASCHQTPVLLDGVVINGSTMQSSAILSTSQPCHSTPPS